VACSLPVLGPGSSLVAVFDGHGGQAAAEAAAARVPDLLGQHLAQGEAAGGWMGRRGGGCAAVYGVGLAAVARC
jgi:hypothetical protein